VEELLVLRRAPDGDVIVEELPEGLSAILRASEQLLACEALQAIAQAHGADPGEAAAIVDGLVRDGLLG
jgi:hypothetical protein